MDDADDLAAADLEEDLARLVDLDVAAALDGGPRRPRAGQLLPEPRVDDAVAPQPLHLFEGPHRLARVAPERSVDVAEDVLQAREPLLEVADGGAPRAGGQPRRLDLLAEAARDGDEVALRAQRQPQPEASRAAGGEELAEAPARAHVDRARSPCDREPERARVGRAEAACQAE